MYHVRGNKVFNWTRPSQLRFRSHMKTENANRLADSEDGLPTYYHDINQAFNWKFDLIKLIAAIASFFFIFAIDLWSTTLNFGKKTRGLKSYIITRHKIGQSFCGHKYLKSRFVVAILNFSKTLKKIDSISRAIWL